MKLDSGSLAPEPHSQVLSVSPCRLSHPPSLLFFSFSPAQLRPSAPETAALPPGHGQAPRALSGDPQPVPSARVSLNCRPGFKSDKDTQTNLKLAPLINHLHPPLISREVRRVLTLK